MENQYVDVNSPDFDFLFADGIVEDTVEGSAVKEDEIDMPDLVEDDYDSDEEYDEPDFDFSEIDEDSDENEIEDLEDKSTEDKSINPTEYFSTLEDDTPINFGDVQMTKSEIVGLVSKNKDVETKHQALEQYVSNFSEIDKKMSNQFTAAITETEHQYQTVMRKLNDPSTTQSEKGALLDDVNRLQSRFKHLQTGVANHEALIKQRETIELKRRHDITNEVMSKELGSKWTPEFASEVIKYGMDNGLTGNQIAKTLSPELFKMLIKAKSYDETETRRSAKLKQTITGKAPRSVRTTNSSRGESVNKSNRVRKEYLDKIQSGNIDDRDVSNMFSVLED